MNDPFEKELRKFVNSVDDDLVESEIEQLLHDGYIMPDNDRILSLSLDKFKTAKMSKRTKWAYKAACVIVALIVSLNAGNIYGAIQNYFSGKTKVYNQFVEGKAYYLKDRLSLFNKETILKIVASNARYNDGSLRQQILIKFMPTLTLEETIENLTVSAISSNGEEIPFDLVFFNGYNLYLISSKGLDIEEFGRLRFETPNQSYDLTLTEADEVADAESFRLMDKNEKCAASIDIAAKISETPTQHVVELLINSSDKQLHLVNAIVGDPPVFRTEYDNEEMIMFSTSTYVPDLLNPYDPYVVDENGNKKRFLRDGDFEDTIFSAFKPSGKTATVHWPALMMQSTGEINSTTVTVPENGDIMLLDQVINLNYEIITLKKITRLSETQLSLDFVLGSDNDKPTLINYDLRTKITDVSN